MTHATFYRAILQPALKHSECSFADNKSMFNILHNKKYIPVPSYITPTTTNKQVIENEAQQPHEPKETWQHH